jgi:tetratricopeptide (TPR) repeat protein/predicted Ser/Thr protein kinase
MADPALGTTFDRYVLREKLGQGGMGVVYLAEDTRLGRNVALKFLPEEFAPTSEATQRFTTEARAAAKLNHPNVATVYEISECDGRSFISMEHVEGRTLKSLLDDGPLPIDRVRSLAQQVADGLAAAHAARVLHRDVKPANVLVTTSGIAKLVDFGLAKTDEKSLSKTGQIMGTADYMAPEQIDGSKVGPTADVWGFGVLLYEMISGQRPFASDRLPGTLYKIISEPHTPLRTVRPDTPADLRHLVDRCLEKGPDARYPSMVEVAEVLRGEVPSTPARGRALRKPFPTTTKRALVIGVALAGGVLFTSIRGFRNEQPLPTSLHLAVLPFTVSEGLDSAFSSGITESVVTRLAGVEPLYPSFWVIRDATLGTRQIGSAADARASLGATVVLTGAMTRVGDSIQTELVLIDVENGRRLRSGVARGLATDPAGLQDSVALRSAELLELDFQTDAQRLILAGGAAANSASNLFLRGTDYLGRWRQPGQLDVAISMFEQSLEEDPGLSLSHAALAQAYLRNYELTKDTVWASQAERESDRAVELMGEGVTLPHLTLGQIHTATGAYGRALTSFTYVLEREPGSSPAYFGRARSYESLNRHEEAERDLRSGLALRPLYWEGYSALGAFLYRRGRVDEAAQQFREMTRLVPDYAAGHRSLGGALFYLDRLDEAVQAFERALVLEPSYTVYMNLATTYYFQPDYPRAAETYRLALALNDSDYLTWSYLGTSERMAGNVEAARTAWTAMLEKVRGRLAVNPRDPLAQAHLALTELRLGDSEEANRTATALENDAVQDRTVTYILALIREELGERDAALALLDRAFRLGIPLQSVERDPWMRDLRNDPGYSEILPPAGL